MKTRMTRGAFAIRQRYFTMNTFDHFVQLGMEAGFGPAFLSTLRVANQNFLTMPIGIPGLGGVSIARLADLGKRTGALSPNVHEDIRKALQKGGDKAAQTVGEMLSLSKYRIEVNPILEGVDEYIRVGDKIYNSRELRDIATQEGIFSSFDTRALRRNIKEAQASHIKKMADENPGAISRGKGLLEDWTQMVSDTAEAWSERERLGAMVTLMEAGMAPRDAARLSVKALYDYAGSMSKTDRLWWINMILPFWAYQKNANKQVFDALFSPWGAYRLGVIRRSYDYGSEYLTALLYSYTVDPYGVVADKLPPDIAENYWAYRNSIENGYGPIDSMKPQLREMLERTFGPLDKVDAETKNRIEKGYGGVENVPLSVRRAMRMIFQDRSVVVEEGQVYELDHILTKAKERLSLGTGAYTLPKFDKSKRPSHLRYMAGIGITPEMTENTVRYYNLVKLWNPDHMYSELMLPESTINAGMRHITGTLSAMFLVSEAFVPVTRLVQNEEAPPTRKYTDTRALKNLADDIFPIDRAPVVAPLLSEIGMMEAPPVRVHPKLRGLLRQTFGGVEFLEMGSKHDTLAEQFNLEMGFTAEEAKRLSEVERERMYLPGGVYRLLFDNALLGELNRMFYEWEVRPIEDVEKRSAMAAWLRRVAGLRTEEYQASIVARREEPRRLERSRDLP